MASFIGEAYRPEQNTSKETDERERDGSMLTKQIESCFNKLFKEYNYLSFIFLVVIDAI